MKKSTPRGAKSTAELRRLIIERFAQGGVEVARANSLPEALATLQHRQGMLVVLDLMEPQEAEQLVEDLHTTEDGGHQPVLLLAVGERLPQERQLLQ